jgi:hypothetical protein
MRSLLKRSAKAALLQFLGTLLGICMGNINAWADIYVFTDDRGTPHFSNVPDDARYKLFIHVKNPVARVEHEHSEAVPVSSVNPGTFSAEVQRAASIYQLDEALLHAVISAESGYNPHVVSSKGAIGLMQLMPETVRHYRVTNAFDPAQNINAGAQYLSSLLEKFDHNLQLALAAYNAGEGNVRKYGGRIPPFSETLTYVPKVMDLYKRNKQLDQ